MCNDKLPSDRSPLVLEPAEYPAWLDSAVSANALFSMPEKLTLDVELVTV